jgi:hypothetical protein
VEDETEKVAELTTIEEDLQRRLKEENQLHNLLEFKPLGQLEYSFDGIPAG